MRDVQNFRRASLALLLFTTTTSVFGNTETPVYAVETQLPRIPYYTNGYDGIFPEPWQYNTVKVASCSLPDLSKEWAVCSNSAIPLQFNPVCIEVYSGTVLPGIVDGLLLDVRDRYGNTSILGTGWTGSSNGNRFHADIHFSGQYTGIWKKSMLVECSMDVSGSNIPMISVANGPGSTPLSTISWSYPMDLQNLTPGISITQPSPMTGRVGERISSNFTIVVPSWIRETPINVKWKLNNNPCIRWPATLIKTNEPEISIAATYTETLILKDTETEMTAFFTPTIPGGFSCTASLTFDYD